MSVGKAAVMLFICRVFIARFFVILLVSDHTTHTARGIFSIPRAAWYEMHMRIHHCLSGRSAPVHAHVKPVTFSFVHHVSALDLGQTEGLYYMLGVVVLGHEQQMTRGHRVCIAEYMHTTQVREMVLPRCYALELCLL